MFFSLIVTFNFQVGASISQDLQITSVPSFTGQMRGSCFSSNGTLFAGDNNYSLFRSDDNGSSFRLIYHFPSQTNPVSIVAGYVWTIFIDSRGYLFVSIPCTNRLYRSTSFGASFTEILNTNGTQNDGFYIGMTEDSNRSIYAATYSNSVYPNYPTILKSINGGTTCQ